ncbi:MAG: YbaB/EbfC family nucleoid-associated protein [Oscillospiraceae bacterium]|jgi:DNA-binding protein YbaB|nr:YbaB/EbfC family nucleoid-associated protein [Oscillospiraceae bacterium]
MRARLPQGAKVPGGGDISSLTRKAQKMQDDIKKVQEKISEEEFTEIVGDGRVTVVALGDRSVQSIRFSDELKADLKADADSALDEVEDLVTAAVNAVLDKIDAETEARIEEVTDGLSIPGIL